MLKIGEFSKLSMLSVKALRFYDDEGLLKPKSVDDATNYRYYESSQLYDARKIVWMRQAGLSISEIKAIASGSDAEVILEKRLTEIEAEKAEAEKRFLRITKILNDLKEGRKMKFQATIKEIPAYHVFYSAKKLRGYNDLSDFIVGVGAECAAANPTLKCVTPEYCFVTYLDEEYTANDFTAMYAQAVETIGKESENVKFKTLEPVCAVSVIVKGNYMENLPEGYAFALGYVEENGYELAEKPREVYIDGVWNKENPDDYLTEIQIPVRKKS